MIALLLTLAAFSAHGESRTVEATIAGHRYKLTYDLSQAGQNPSPRATLFLCGGPGLPCVGGARPSAIPADEDVLLFDYPGLGQNSGIRDVNTYTIEGISDAAVAVAQTQNRPLTLYGESFGTTVATAAAAKLKNVDRVILEGVFGKGQLNQYDSWTAAAERVWRRLSDTEKVEMRAAVNYIFANLTPGQKNLFIYSFNMNNLAYGTNSALQSVRGFLASYHLDPEQELEFQRMLFHCGGDCVSDSAPPKTLSRAQLAYVLPACQVFTFGRTNASSQAISYGVDGINALIAKRTVDYCALLEHKPPTWNPAKYQIRNAVYFNGEADAQTPIAGARGAFSDQRTTNKVFVEVKDGGHQVLDQAGNLGACAQEIFKKIESSDFSLLQASELQSCNEQKKP